MSSDTHLRIFLLIKEKQILNFRLKLNSNDKKDCSVSNTDIFKSIVSNKSFAQFNNLKFMFLNSVSILNFIILKFSETFPDDELLFESEILNIDNFIIFVSESLTNPEFVKKNLSDLLNSDTTWRKDSTPTWLTIVDFFQNSKLKKVEKNRQLFQLILNDFLDLHSGSSFNSYSEALLEIKPLIIEDKHTEMSVEPIFIKDSCTDNQSYPILDEILLVVKEIFTFQNKLLEKIDYLLQEDLQHNSIYMKSNDTYLESKPTFLQHSESNFSINDSLNDAFPIYKDKIHFDDNLKYVIIDFSLLKLIVKYANYFGQRDKRPRVSQLRLMYSLIWLFGLDLSDLVYLNKIDIELALSQQKIYSKKQERWKVIRNDESLGFVLNLLKIELPYLFDYCQFKSLACSSKYKEQIIGPSFLSVIPNNDLVKTFQQLEINFMGYSLTWKSIKFSYDDYFRKL